MISFPFEVGILGWVSTITFWSTFIVIVIGIVRALKR